MSSVYESDCACRTASPEWMGGTWRIDYGSMANNMRPYLELMYELRV